MTEYCFSIFGARRRAISGPMYFWSRPRGIKSASAWLALVADLHTIQRSWKKTYKEPGQEVVDFWDCAGATHVQKHNCGSIETWARR